MGLLQVVSVEDLEYNLNLQFYWNPISLSRKFFNGPTARLTAEASTSRIHIQRLPAVYYHNIILHNPLYDNKPLSSANKTIMYLLGAKSITRNAFYMRTLRKYDSYTIATILCIFSAVDTILSIMGATGISVFNVDLLYQPMCPRNNFQCDAYLKIAIPKSEISLDWWPLRLTPLQSQELLQWSNYFRKASI